MSTENKIRLSVSTREWTTLNGQRLRIAGIGPTTKNGKTRDHRNKYPSAIWSSIQAQTQESIRKKIAAIGWGQRAWAELARSIGLTINAGRGNTAEIAGKDASTYVSSTQETTADSYTLSVRNAQNLQNWIGGRTAFFSAIAGRVGFFRQNLKHGVFQDLKTVAAKYPGIRVDSD